MKIDILLINGDKIKLEGKHYTITERVEAVVSLLGDIKYCPVVKISSELCEHQYAREDIVQMKIKED